MKLCIRAHDLGCGCGDGRPRGRHCRTRSPILPRRSPWRGIFDLYNYMDADNQRNYLDIMDRGLDVFAGDIQLFHMKDCNFTPIALYLCPDAADGLCRVGDVRAGSLLQHQDGPQLCDVAVDCGSTVAMEGAEGHVCWDVDTLARARRIGADSPRKCRSPGPPSPRPNGRD